MIELLKLGAGERDVSSCSTAAVCDCDVLNNDSISS